MFEVAVAVLPDLYSSDVQFTGSCKFLIYIHCYVLTRGLFVFKIVYILIKSFVVKFFYYIRYISINYLRIDYSTRFPVNSSFNRYFNIIVMTVPVRVRTFLKYSVVLTFGKVVYIQSVCCRKTVLPSQGNSFFYL